jgi:hypothetical protein
MFASRSQRTRWTLRVLAAGAIVAVVPLSMPQAQRYVPGSNPELPRIRYADSLLSLNDRCIVRMSKLNLRVRPVYVSRAPIGFC